MSSQVSSQKGLSFPVGTDVRTPELCTPTQCSPMNRSKIISEMQPNVAPIVQDVNMDHPHGPSLPSSTESASNPIQVRMDRVNAATNADAHIARGSAMRDAQLRDLLTMRGMWGRSASSSSTARLFKNIFDVEASEERKRTGKF